MYFIKIVSQDNKEFIINKLTTLETYITDFKLITDKIGINSDIIIKTVPLGLEIFENKTVINKGYIYNTTLFKKVLLYKLSLVEISDQFTFKVDKETQSEDSNLEEYQPLISEIEDENECYSSDEDIVFTKKSIPYDYSNLCYVKQDNQFIIPVTNFWKDEPPKWDFQLMTELKSKLIQPNLGLSKY